MTIVTVQFNYPPEMNMPDYGRLLRVFAASVAKHEPGATFTLVEIPPPMSPVPGKALNFWYNTIKLREWVRVLEEIDDNVVLADCDMLMNAPLGDVFDEDFDVAYTERTETRMRCDAASLKYWGPEPIRRMPMNGGIMLVKPTAPAREFFRLLLETNERLYQQTEEHLKWNVKYAGMNQAAFGCLFETGEYRAKIKAIPCRRYNAVDTDWHTFGGDTVFLHVKSKLRRLVLSRQRPYGNLKAAMSAWNDVAREIGERAFSLPDR